jgi:hypothetical protein
MDGPAHLIAWNFCRILLGLFAGTAAIIGFAVAPLSISAHILYGAISLLVVLPPESFAGGNYVNFAGIALAIIVLAADYLRRASAVKPGIAASHVTAAARPIPFRARAIRSAPAE